MPKMPIIEGLSRFDISLPIPADIFKAPTLQHKCSHPLILGILGIIAHFRHCIF
jgi:hypothetical protein